MNRERAKELWPIIKAFGEGETIQYGEDLSSLSDLSDNGDLGFDVEHFIYRIKPEPREFKLAIGPKTGEIFKFDKDLPWTGYEIIKVREVLDDE